MNEIILISAVSLILTLLLSIISIYFRHEYKVFKQIARDFVDTASKLLDIVDDDRITEDEFKDLIIHLKYLVMRTQKTIKPLKK